MKKKYIHFFLTVLALISLVVNSCKKDNTALIRGLFIGKWQLASIYVTYSLGSASNTDTLNTSCDSTQIFTFNSDNTCSYTNYHCVTQPVSTGTWSVSKDQFYLTVNMACKDTASGGVTIIPAQAFANTQIYSIGPYSMTLRTGDYGTYYTANSKRTLYQYAFVRQKATITQ